MAESKYKLVSSKAELVCCESPVLKRVCSKAKKGGGYWYYYSCQCGKGLYRELREKGSKSEVWQPSPNSTSSLYQTKWSEYKQVEPDYKCCDSKDWSSVGKTSVGKKLFTVYECKNCGAKVKSRGVRKPGGVRSSKSFDRMYMPSRLYFIKSYVNEALKAKPIENDDNEDKRYVRMIVLNGSVYKDGAGKTYVAVKDTVLIDAERYVSFRTICDECSKFYNETGRITSKDALKIVENLVKSKKESQYE